MDSRSSSPDPLGDDPPSSALSYARRTTNHNFTNHDLSAISIPGSQLTRTSPRRQSPRKRTFELDVGNALSPQKILVTVEAEEAMKRGLNRRLFPSPSPTRSSRRGETTTTTTIPLNDEIENESTPRRRGRPRRISNGTPMPRGKKRAGTPMEKESRQTRRKSGPESDASIFNDTPVQQKDPESSPSKPKPRPRKTPKNASKAQAVPSSQLSNGAKRKRGRPRKVPAPEELPIFSDAGDQTAGNVASDNTVGPVEDHSVSPQPPEPGQSSDIRNEEYRQETGYDDTQDLIDEIAQESDMTPVPEDISRTKGTQEYSGSQTSPHQHESDEEDMAMGEDYPEMMEPHSDAESDFTDTGSAPRYGQDTLAHASDFSMIAVESLPSFQANRSAFPSDPPEMGEETSNIINQTLESLRRSTQTEVDEDDILAGDGQSNAPDGSLAEIGDSTLLGRLRSPRRQREVPLSRQVFSGKTRHVDDSFSSIPESILHAATPGRLPMKATSATNQHDDSNLYEDSFSEIPEEILEAATPRPPTRTTRPAEESHDYLVGAVDRNSGPDFGSSRLPTPDDTSSSNAGSKRAQEDEIEAPSRAQTVADSHPNSGVRSSPPIMTRPRAMDFGPSRLDQEINKTPALQQSSPQLPHSAKETAKPSKALEPPPNIRPSLSPIVRVGRTLQNVMSDRPSPDGREGSLGSPFRGSMGNDYLQPVMSDRSVDSPIRASHMISAQSRPPYRFNTRPALAQSTRSNLSNSQPPAQGGVIGDVGDMSDPFGPDMPDYPEAETLKDSTHSSNNPVSQVGHSAYLPSMADSTRATWSSNRGIRRTDDNQQDIDQHSGQETTRSRTSSAFATRGSNMSQAVATDIEAVDYEMEDQEQIEENYGELPEEDNDADLWDIEASRLTPEKPERIRTAPQQEDPPPRRTKIPSPWRKTSRRLIYREEIASPSQITIEESPRSEADNRENPSVARPRRRRSEIQSQLQGKRPEPATFHEPSPSPPVQRVPEPEFEPEPEHEPEPEFDEAPEMSPEPIDEPEYSMLLDQNEATPANQEKSVDASEYSMLAQRTRDPLATQEKPASIKSRLLGGFNLMSFFSSPASLPKELPTAVEGNAYNKTGKIAQPNFQKPTSREPEMSQLREPQQSLWSTGLFPSMPQKEFQPSPERRSDLFSPAPALPSNDTVPDTYEDPSLSPAPSPSPEPSPAPSYSPEPDSPEPSSPEYNSPEHNLTQSHPPSTPERQIYPPIEQKQNFTPLPGQNSGYLFRRGPSAARSEAETDLLQLPSDDQQESSMMTDGTDYERLPPREKPSRWDKNLSPAKSSFRSPLKPTTPGRVVAFSNGALSPTAQAEARAERQNSLRGNGVGFFSQGQPLRPISENRETESTASTSFSRRPLRNLAPAPAPAPALTSTTSRSSVPPIANRNTSISNNTVPKPQPQLPQLQPRRQPQQQPQPQPQPRAFALSQTEWTRQHWVRMDELLQLRRRDPLLFQQIAPLPPRSQRLALAADLIGKEVSAQGESILLEAWHLDVVDAFRHEVGAWDVRALAKRLFALIVGEERRRVAKEAKREKVREMEMQMQMQKEREVEVQKEREREMGWRAGRAGRVVRAATAGYWG